MVAEIGRQLTAIALFFRHQIARRAEPLSPSAAGLTVQLGSRSRLLKFVPTTANPRHQNLIATLDLEPRPSFGVELSPLSACRDFSWELPALEAGARSGPREGEVDVGRDRGWVRNLVHKCS